MSDFDPVEIRLDLVQNVDSEGEKSTAAINDIAAASNKLKTQFEKDIAAQKTMITQLVSELKTLKETMSKKVDTGDEKQLIDKQKMIDQIDILNKKLLEQEAILDKLRSKQGSGSAPGKGTLPGMPADPAAYAKGVNTLNFSMQQIARELPNFAISPMIGIMALSNNLPILQDSLNKMVAVNKALKASGQETIPVWKQITSSIFSWQTGLIAGITVLMLFGKQIGNGISNLFSFRDAAKLSRDEVNKLSEDLSKKLGSDLGQLDMLFDRLKKAKKGTSEYSSAKTEIIDQYGKYLNGMNSEITTLNNLEGAYKAVRNEILENARAEVLLQRYKDESQKLNSETETQYIKIRQSLIGQFGNDMGEFKFKQFRQELESGKGLSLEMQRYVAEFDTKRRDVVGTSTSGAVQYGSEYTYNPIKNSIDAITKAQGEYNTRLKQYESTIGSLAGGEKKVNDSLIEQAELRLKAAKLLPDATKEQLTAKNIAVEAAEKELEKLKNQGKTDKSAIETKNKKLTAASDLSQMEIDIELKKQQSIVELMNDGVEKQKALRKQSYLEELSDLDKQQKEYVSKLNDKLGKKPTDKGYVTSLDSYVASNPTDKGASSFMGNTNEQRLIADQSYVKDVEKLDADAAQNRVKVFAQATEAFLSDMEKEKQAINEKYDESIKRATEQGATQAEIDKLNELRSLAIAQVQSKSVLKLSSFYQQLYGNIDQLSARGLQSLQTQLSQVLATAQQIDKNGQTFIQVSIPGDQFDKDGKRIQQTVNMTIDEFQRLKESGQKLEEQYSRLRPFEALIDSFKDYKTSNEEVRQAQEELNQLEQSGTASVEDLAKANDKVTQAQNKRAASLQKTTSSLNKIGNTGRELVGSANEVIGTLEDLGVKVGDNTKKSIEGVGKMFDAMSEIDLTKPMSIVTSTIKFVAGLGTTIAGIFGGKKKVISEETFAQYERLIDTIDQVISRQKELLASLSGVDAKAQYDQSIALIEKQIEATKNLGTDYLNSGADGNSHSLGYKLKESLKKYASDFNSIGIDFSGLGGRMTGLFDLSPEQLTNIKENLPQAWAALDDKTRGYLQNIIDSGDAITDMNEALKESLTNLSFESAKSALEDLLLSADTTMEDIAENFQDYMREAIVNMIADKYMEPLLEQWYKDFAKAMEDGQLTTKEKEKLQKSYQDIYNGSASQRDQAYAAAGIDAGSTESADTRSGSAKGIAQASQDSVDEMNGRMTAVQAYIYDIRNINKQSLDFDKETAAYEAAVLSHLQSIVENTDYCKYLLDVKNLLSDIQLKGVKII